MCRSGARAAHPAEHHAEGTCRAGRRGGRHDQTLRKDRRGAVPHRPHHRPGFETAGGLHRPLQDPGCPDLALPSRTKETQDEGKEACQMKIQDIKIHGFRNFLEADINFAAATLIIGANDIGKSNLLYAIRILLDNTLSESAIEPAESDFHISREGKQEESFFIQVHLVDIKEDAVISCFKGFVSEDGSTFLKYFATRRDFSYSLYIGPSEDSLEKIETRYPYLKYIHLKYIQSMRDLLGFIRVEKKHLLQMAKKERTPEDIESDTKKEKLIQHYIANLNSEVNSLSYVSNATHSINDELKQLSLHNTDYSVRLEAQEIELSTYIEQLSLNASSFDKNIGIGGDGRNNQVLMALWKAKGDYEIDSTAEAVIYCVEEPEAHLHPHQQRKFAKYLVENLRGQVIVTSHSPQIVERFSPNNIIRLCNPSGATVAATKGCSSIIEKAWNNFGYRMSIIPAETFFSDAVFLVEGPSEEILYKALAYAQGIDLDFLNISILQVGGVTFSVYARILRAMSIPFVVRTDNDIIKGQAEGEWFLSGINRGRRLVGLNNLPNENEHISHADICNKYNTELVFLKENGIFISHRDLEHDLAEIIPQELCNYFEVASVEDAVQVMQKSKAVNMNDFIVKNRDVLSKQCFHEHDLLAPLLFLVDTLGFKGG